MDEDIEKFNVNISEAIKKNKTHHRLIIEDFIGEVGETDGK